MNSASRVRPDRRATPPVVARHQQSTVVEDAVFVGLRLDLEVLADLPPEVALHGFPAAVFPAHAQRQPLGGMPDEVIAEQFVELVAITRRQRSVERHGSGRRGAARFDGHVRPGT